MAKLKSDSPICHRLVHAFLDFLDSVEIAPGTDREGLEVAKECLEEVFRITRSSADSRPEPDLLLNIFRSQVESEQLEAKSDVGHEAAGVPSTSSAQNTADANIAAASRYLVEDRTSDLHTSEISEDELFGQFFGALEKIHYFKTTSDGHDDQVQLDRATHLFQNALAEMRKSGGQTFDQKSLAETLKSQGNKAMQSKLFSEAIELYSCAIALCENKAVYYCNRAAAYTQIQQYTEAIRDCHKSIEIDPNYSKAYSRLGFAYYAQGNYRDAICKGFLRALQLDPNNASVKENIRVAEQKLREELQRSAHNQSTSSGHGAVPPMFSSMPFGGNGIPADLASLFRNMNSGGTYGFPPVQPSEAGGGNNNGDTATFIETASYTLGGNGNSGNLNVNLSNETPEELTGALRSMMEMFSGATPPQPQDDNNNNNVNGRPAPPAS